jgi:hypothetical protein
VAECIHGMEGTQCAICFPKPDPVPPPRVVNRTSRTGTAASTPRRSPRVAGGASAASRAAATPKKQINVGEQRIYHLTHIENLSQIISSGAILANTNDELDERPAVDISAPATREARNRATVFEPEGVAVADYVPFFLSPNASVWRNIRSQIPDVRLSTNAHEASAYDFVLLISTIQHAYQAQGEDAADAANVIVTDGDASGTLTRFGTSRESSERMLRGMRADEESDTILHAELLVRDRLPFERVTLIGVANDNVRNAVKQILAHAAYKPKVSVYPPWFQPAE